MSQNTSLMSDSVRVEVVIIIMIILCHSSLGWSDENFILIFII